MATKTINKINLIEKARKDVSRILNRYRLTIPEIIGVSPAERDIDEEIWNSVRKDYEKVQEEIFAKAYPDLWKKVRKR